MLKKNLPIKNILLLLAVALIAVNLFYTGLFIRNKRHAIFNLYFEPGYQFLMMKDYLKNVETIGYLTNNDVSRENNDGAFLQAQYFLAPTLLQLQAENHEFLIIDSHNVPYIVATIRRLSAPRIANNEYGQALLRKINP